jgi:hypothetical protein
LKVEQVAVELPVNEEQLDEAVTHPPLPLYIHPFKNVSQSESYDIPVA